MKPKYRLNPETLTYEKIGEDSGLRMKNIVWVLISSVGFGFLFILLAAYLYPTPNEKKLRQDLTVLEENFDNLSEKLEESVALYEELIEKEKEIQILTFDAEIEQLKSLSMEMSLYSPDFDFAQLVSITQDKVMSASEKSAQLIWKIRILLDIAYAKKMFLQSVPAILPIDKENFVLVSGYGKRIHPIFKTLRQHNGVDLAARQGTPVYATGAGTIIRPPQDLEGLGNIVAIDHGFGYVSVYACLLKSEVKQGNKVERGQIIGSVGRSGVASGPHLHYEVRKNNKPLNPVNYFFLSVTPDELLQYMEKASVQNQNMS